MNFNVDKVHRIQTLLDEVRHSRDILNSIETEDKDHSFTINIEGSKFQGKGRYTGDPNFYKFLSIAVNEYQREVLLTLRSLDLKDVIQD